MSNVDYENNLPATKYINYLNNSDVSTVFSDNNIINTIMKSAYLGTKHIGAWFYKNYEYIRGNSIDRKRRCIDLNYWLDEKKEQHKKLFPEIHEQQWNFIEQLRSKIESDRIQGKKCEKKFVHYPLDYRRSYNELSHFCENRDYLRNLCHSSKHSISAKDVNCSNLSHYVNRYYEIFSKKHRCLKDRNNDSDNEYVVSNECTLYDMSKTFPEYIFENKKISEKTNARKDIILCPEYEKLLICPKENEPEPLLIRPTQSSSICPPTQNILYGVLALLGIISAFFTLYNFTSIGSWLRGCMIRNQIARRDVDENEECTLSDDSSDILDMNSENKAYYLAYKPG
ncbi:PIR protein [Plasmodium ovale]|uniref:PIR protein n=1 Tax=Plasmodium ovale TaxID=36330 RepID=A0A1D3JEA6_PLAOA|nr:PIR protein [Plasmodium ovale]